MGRAKPCARRLPAGLAPATPAAATAATEIATATRRLGSGFVDRERPTAELLPVQRARGALRFLVGRHLDEGESARATRCHIAHHLHCFDLSSTGEELLKLCFADAVRK